MTYWPIPGPRSRFQRWRREYTLAAHDTILTALNGLCDERKRRLIGGMYFEGRTMTEAAELAGYSSKQGADQGHKWALRRLRRCSYTRSLHELLGGFGEVDPYADGLRGVGARRWRETGESATERVAVRLMEGGRP